MTKLSEPILHDAMLKITTLPELLEVISAVLKVRQVHRTRVEPVSLALKGSVK
jgi:hypothetical protein